MKKVRILSLDGGGIRGIIPATIIQYIENKLVEWSGNPNARIADYFDLIAGTSTGGILSCFYLTPNGDKTPGGPSSKYTASTALEFYSEKGFSIFNQSKRNGWLGIGQLFNATQYNPKTLESIFTDKFGTLTMTDLLKPCLVPTYDMMAKSSYFFTSREPKELQREFYVKDVARSTSAAPTYFPPAQIRNLLTNQLMVNIDGGVFANNPTMCAYAEARNTAFPQVQCPSAKDMLILSIGTGGGQFDLPTLNKSGKWGVINWAKSIPDIMMDGSVDTVDFELKNIFTTLEKENQFNYKRINVPLDQRNYASDMADASPGNIEKLKQAGQATLQAAQQPGEREYTLDQFIEQLIVNAPDEQIS